MLLVNDLKNVMRHQTKILPLVKLRLTRPKGLSITLKDFLIGQLTGLEFASHWPVTILDVPPLDRIVELVVEEVETDGLNIDTNFDDEEGGEMQMEQHDESDLCIDTTFHDDDGEIGPDDGSQSSGTQRRLLNSKRCATSSANCTTSTASCDSASLWSSPIRSPWQRLKRPTENICVAISCSLSLNLNAMTNFHYSIFLKRQQNIVIPRTERD